MFLSICWPRPAASRTCIVSSLILVSRTFSPPGVPIIRISLTNPSNRMPFFSPWLSAASVTGLLGCQAIPATGASAFHAADSIAKPEQEACLVLVEGCNVLLWKLLCACSMLFGVCSVTLTSVQCVGTDEVSVFAMPRTRFSQGFSARGHEYSLILHGIGSLQPQVKRTPL
jgi:hypothetical protein